MKQLREKQAVTDMIPPVPQQNPGRRMPWGESKFPELPAGAVSQKQLSRMRPPTGHIWNNWKGRGWMAHLEAETKSEFPRISEPWTTHAPNRARDPQSLEKGRQLAGIIVLRRLWGQYCKWKVIELSDGPVKNLFPEGATLADGSEEESDEEASEDDDDDDDDDEDV